MIRPATEDECFGIASRLREADRNEIAASSGLEPEESLARAWAGSAEVMAWVLNGNVEAISGAAPIGDGKACVWLLGSDALFGSAKWQFVRHSRPEVERLVRKWGNLVGYVHAANTAHVRWLQWCGFELYEPITRGAKAELFYPFQRSAHV